MFQNVEGLNPPTTQPLLNEIECNKKPNKSYITEGKPLIPSMT